ncbi:MULTISPECIES: ribosome hibernation-promoting factor, HPF/YfiA family [unclassified Pseudofrankia]|uniref:ribosome hibernation-promoting factor, HPF/YfiA family n=1 Tax=unclassified Pseudofrankia TaxID=2994372 RepID=UPI0008DB1C4F|nr:MULTISPECIES: ribosome-associated translation inhibitor RaiA [unclassified Pseudofrankia]MDT3439000.1 ribosome-associated translation inhibitor RaiA [Pseudofrankia sp. BMG5.37]OHV50604.1 ribosomal subunit interface protein [Pseudofrankia sp. BMG5.36]
MDIVVKGRHTAVPERFRTHVQSKLAKLERYDGKVIRVDVELSRERNPRMSDVRERVELTLYSRGPVIRAEAAAADPYSALDGATNKLAERLRRAAERRADHQHGNHGQGHGRAYVGPPLTGRGDRGPAASEQNERRAASALPGQGSATTGAPAPSGGGVVTPADVAAAVGRRGTAGTGQRSPGASNGARPAGGEREFERELEGIDVDRYEQPDRSPMIVRTKTHRAAPMTLDDALSNMELVGHDFYLFQDQVTGQASVVYRRRGYDYGVIHLIGPEDPAAASDEEREPMGTTS